MCPPDEDPPRDQGSDPAPRREHGASPVVQRPRNILGTILGVMGICVAVAFLFLTGSHKAKPQPQAKPVIAANGDAALPPALADQPPQMPDHERITFPGEVPNNPQHYGPGQTESAEAERQKAEARRHSPMLIYDSSGKEEAPAPAKKVWLVLTSPSRLIFPSRY